MAMDGIASPTTLTPTTWWLVVDTASPRLSLALVCGDTLCGQFGARSQKPSAHQAVADIAYLLERVGIQPTDLSAVGALVGPGSFTGIRVGLAAVKGIAQPLGLPIATATTLEALASAVSVQSPTVVLVVNVSHRQEVHGQGFLAQPNAFPQAVTEALTGEVASVLKTLVAQAPDECPRVITGDGLTLLDESALNTIVGMAAHCASPPWLAPVAIPLLAARLAAGQTRAAREVTAFYARAALTA
ncbi:MAG: tRNA (adenosine(37)-N6)-threonylcarbamoyltransferase complex dimerization subunit type 1 TsaB [Chloracidobacterium sp.]|nr:tRNA (adenosine(37)-N6)-threonylcarbamoyltransferase complex dimerization subunit type 1 TsaB [Chloracidobacterium validum]